MGIVNRTGSLLLLCVCWPVWALMAQPCSVSLGADTALCAANFTMVPNVSFSVHEDSLRIRYDASQGQSGLAGASKVYMHSGAELQPFGGWQIVVGNWGQDDGIGQMRPLGNDIWEITLHVWNYYGIASGSALNGLFMVFRNADGSQTGKDDNGNDIWLNMGTQPPSSAFAGVTASIRVDALDSIVWSDGSHGLSLNVGGPGTYWVEVTDTGGCSARDSITIDLAQLPIVDLGQPAICNGQPAQLDAGAGYASYAWSTGASTQNISVSTAGIYLVTVTDALGCQGSDVVNVPAQSTPVAAFTYNVQVGTVVNFTNTSIDGTSFYWDFDGDGNDDSQSANATVGWVYPTMGNYPVRLIAANSCGVDTFYQTVSVAVGRTEQWEGSWQLAPNPSQGWVEFSIARQQGGHLSWRIYDVAGRQLRGQDLGMVGPSHRARISLDDLPDGLYLLEVQHGQSRNSQRVLLQR